MGGPEVPLPMKISYDGEPIENHFFQDSLEKLSCQSVFSVGLGKIPAGNVKICLKWQDRSGNPFFRLGNGLIQDVI